MLQWSLWLLCEERTEWGWVGGQDWKPQDLLVESGCMRDGRGLDQNRGSQGPGKWWIPGLYETEE